MKAGWEIKRISDVCQIVGGGTPSKSVSAYWTGDIPWVSPKDMKSDVVSDSIDHISARAVENSATSLIPKDSVLVVVRSGILARTIPIGLTDRNLTINQDLKALCPNKSLSPKFLFYFLHSRTDELLAMVTKGATVHRLMTEQLRTVGIRVPPLPEQHRIVKMLDEAFENIATAKANAENNLQNARALFESLLDALYSDEVGDSVVRSLDDVCQITSALVDPRLPEHQKLLHVGGANIESGTGKLLGLLTAEDEQLISGKFLFDESMILYSKIRPYLMKVARPDFRGLCSADIYPLSAKAGKIDRHYLYYLLLSPRFTEYANMGSARAGMPKVNREHLFAYRFNLPALERQMSIARTLDGIQNETRRLESIYQAKIAALDELKKSLLHQAFNGDL